MFERFTEKARRVVFFALYEARQYGSTEIEPEHVLLGLIREEKSLQRWVPRLDSHMIRERIDELVTKGPPTPISIDLPLSPSVRAILKSAMDEADRLGSKTIGIEHLLLGLIAEGDSRIGKFLVDEGGANPSAIREYFAKQSTFPRPWSFQRASFRDYGFRTLSVETVQIHGCSWNVDYVRDAIHLVRAYNWHWYRTIWRPRDIVIYCKDGTCSFDLRLAEDSTNYVLVKDGWKKDHCFVCRWELYESADEHGIGYTNGHDWLCRECYERFWLDPGFFSSSYSDIT